MEWSSLYSAGDKIPDRRKCSSYVELACLADVLTGGAIGLRKATFAEKAAIMKDGIAKLTRKTLVTDSAGNTMEAKKLFQQLPSVSSAAAVGFPSLPGISRLQVMTKFPGAHTAVGALLNYANYARYRYA